MRYYEGILLDVIQEDKVLRVHFVGMVMKVFRQAEIDNKEVYKRMDRVKADYRFIYGPLYLPVVD